MQGSIHKKFCSSEDATSAFVGVDIVLISTRCLLKAWHRPFQSAQCKCMIVHNLIEQITCTSLKFCIGIIINPVNMTVAIARTC